jgi:Protein of unknown function (DUF2934)
MKCEVLMNLTYNTNRQLGAEDSRRRIAQRAYELYEQRGRQEGFAMQDWLQAEHELDLLAQDASTDKFLVGRAG